MSSRQDPSLLPNPAGKREEPGFAPAALTFGLGIRLQWHILGQPGMPRRERGHPEIPFSFISLRLGATHVDFQLCRISGPRSVGMLFPRSQREIIETEGGRKKKGRKTGGRTTEFPRDSLENRQPSPGLDCVPASGAGTGRLPPNGTVVWGGPGTGELCSGIPGCIPRHGNGEASG